MHLPHCRNPEQQSTMHPPMSNDTAHSAHMTAMHAAVSALRLLSHRRKKPTQVARDPRLTNCHQAMAVRTQIQHELQPPKEPHSPGNPHLTTSAIHKSHRKQRKSEQWRNEYIPNTQAHTHTRTHTHTQLQSLIALAAKSGNGAQGQDLCPSTAALCTPS